MRRRWVLVGALAVVGLAGGVGGAAGYAATRSPEHHASVRVLVSVASAADLADVSAGSRFTHQVAESYADVATTPFVLEGVITDLGLPLTTKQLAAEISATVPDDTTAVDITVSDRTSARAVRIADAVAHRLVAAGHALTPAGGGVRVRLTQIEAARPTS